jgi:hypothetical protein
LDLLIYGQNCTKLRNCTIYMFQTRINASLTFKYMAGPNSRAFISSHVAINAEIIGEIIGEIIAEIIAEINAEIIAAIIAFRKLYLRVHGYVFGSNKCAQEGEGVVCMCGDLRRLVWWGNWWLEVHVVAGAHPYIWVSDRLAGESVKFLPCKDIEGGDVLGDFKTLSHRRPLDRGPRGDQAEHQRPRVVEGC